MREIEEIIEYLKGIINYGNISYKKTKKAISILERIDRKKFKELCNKAQKDPLLISNETRSSYASRLIYNYLLGGDRDENTK